MKNTKGYLIIGLSIIISALIISFSISNRNYSAKEDCYKKTYERKLQTYKKANELHKKESGSEYYTDKQMKSRSAQTAIITCRIK